MNRKNAEIRKIGVWMDHAEARLIEPGTDAKSIRAIQAPGSGRERFPGESPDGTQLGNYRSTNNEFHKHRKEENNIREYFEYLVTQLQSYDEIFIFGPTTAAKEFNNYTQKEKVLLNKIVELEKADYMTDPQLIKRVKDYFSAQ